MQSDSTLDFATLHRVAKLVTRNADTLFDVSTYPTEQARQSAKQTRALGIGILRFADALQRMHYPFDSARARLLNKIIFETIYHAALEASTDLAVEHGPYPSWHGCAAERNELQYDMWDSQPTDMYDFRTLKSRIVTFGLRNATLTAQPAGSTVGAIFGFQNSTDPHDRRVSQDNMLLNVEPDFVISTAISAHQIHPLQRSSCFALL